MMAIGYPFNGASLTFDTASLSSQPITIRSWSTSGGERPEIDITTTTDTYRKMMPGLESPISYAFDCVYQSPAGVTDAAWKAILESWHAECEVGTLTLTIPTSCSDTDDVAFSGNAWVTGLTFEGSIDSAISMQITFMMEAS